MVSLGHWVLGAFALSLGLPLNYFKLTCQKSMLTVRLHYHPHSIIYDEDQLGFGAHTELQK